MIIDQDEREAMAMIRKAMIRELAAEIAALPDGPIRRFALGLIEHVELLEAELADARLAVTLLEGAATAAEKRYEETIAALEKKR